MILSGDQDSSVTKITLERSSDGGRNFVMDRLLKLKRSSSDSYSTVAELSNFNSAYDYRMKAEVFVYDEDNNEIDYDVAYID